MPQHTEDLRNVQEGDSVEITTTNGETFEAECTKYTVDSADPRTGEIREIHMWAFDAVEYQPVVSITEGLKSSPDDPDFPLHSQAFDRQQEQTMGYIESLTIYGKMQA